MNRQSATAIQRGIAAVDALTWKPGPPPLDVPGMYIISVPDQWEIPQQHVAFCLPGGDILSEMGSKFQADRSIITHHFGRIPSPPSGDTE